ncbi:MAG: endonuclease V [Brevinematia bacterium]
MNFEILNLTLSAKTHEECKRVQLLVRDLIEFRKLDISKVKIVAGVDVSYKGDEGIGVLVLVDFEKGDVIQTLVSRSKVSFPYIPGLLAFREIPVVIDLFSQLSIHPDVVIVDGQGIAHPLGVGFATHLGTIIEMPTIGSAKSLLYGTYVDLPNVLCADSPIIDPKTGNVIGKALKTKLSSRPIFVSVGNFIDLDSSVEIVKKLTFLGDCRLPIPIFWADKISKEERKKLLP